MFEKSRSTTSLAAAIVFCAAVALFCLAFAASSAMAHGVVLEESRGDAVEIIAAYDNGDIVSEGQVVVYSPEDPEEPWATGTADEEGRYVFMPDEPGSWLVQVREAGHGANIAVEVEEDGGDGEPAESAAEEGSGNSSVETERTSSIGGNTPLQTGLMAALGLWGFIGTALFFRGRRN